MSTKSCYKWSIWIVVLQRTPSCSCLLLSLSWHSMFLLKSLVYFNVPQTSSCGQVSWLSLGATTHASHTSQPANQLWTLVEFAHIFASPGQFCDLASFCCLVTWVLQHIYIHNTGTPAFLTLRGGRRLGEGV